MTSTSGGVQWSTYDGRHVSAKRTVASWSLVASSAPFSVFRNSSRYIYNPSRNYGESLRNAQQSIWYNDAKKKAHDQTSFYLQEVSDYAIPSGLLYETILDDLVTRRRIGGVKQKQNTLTHFSHGDSHLLVHTGGKNLDELIVRNMCFLQPQYSWKAQPCFSINLGQGSQIYQVKNVGISSFGNSTNLLVRTASEVFHVQSTDMSHLTYEHSRSFGHILEPKAKFQLPETLCDMTASEANNWNYAFMISQHGNLYAWNPLRGVQKVTSNPIISTFPESPQCFSAYAPGYMIESTLHPKILYTARGNRLFHYDVRTAKAVNLFTNHYNPDQIDYNHQQFRSKVPRNEKTASTAIHSIKAHGYCEHMYSLSTPTSLLLMDARYSRTHLFQKALYYPHDHLEYTRLNMFDTESESHSPLDVYLGISHDSSQIQLHCTHQPYQLQRGTAIACPQILQNPSGNSNKFSDIYSPIDALNSASSFSKSDCIRCESEAFPKVDSFDRCIGVQLIPVSALNIICDEEESDRTNSKEYSALLLQQSGIGDVYAQRISTTRPQKVKVRIPSSSNPQQNGSRGLTNRNPQFQDYFSQQNGDDEDDDDSADATTNVQEILKLNTYPPVQLNLPIGNRCYVEESAEVTYGKLISPLEGVKFKRSKLFLQTDHQSVLLQAFIDIRNFFYHHAQQSHELYPGLVTEQRLVSIFDVQRSKFPMSSNAFRKFIPENSMLGFDALEFFPQDLRRDLPQLPKDPEFTAIPAAIATVHYADEIDSFIRNHLESLQKYVATTGAATLWEIWKYMHEVTNRKLSVSLLRQSLLRMNFYELWIPCRLDKSVDMVASHYSSDGLMLKKFRPNQSKGSRRKAKNRTKSGSSNDHYSDNEENDDDSDDSENSKLSGNSQKSTSDQTNPYSCMCAANTFELEKWQQGNRGGYLNNVNHVLICNKRNCILPHRLTYSYLETSTSRVNTAVHTPFSSSSQLQQSSTLHDQSSDVTDDIISALRDTWDESAGSAFPEWPNILDKDLHKKKNETL